MGLQPASKPVYLIACGVATSVGLSNEQTAAAVRAGISAYEDSPVYNKRFNPMKMALLPDDALPLLDDNVANAVPGLTSRQSRILRLAHLAMDDLANKFDKLNGLPLMLAGPETLPDMPKACHPDVIEHIARQSGVMFHDKHNVLLSSGRAAGLRALHYAMAYVEAGMSNYAIVGGVDTYLDLYLLATLDMQDRIIADGVMDGFTPGEGAGFFVIGNKAEPFEDTDQSICVSPPGLALETGHRFSQEPYQGNGLAESFTLALEHANLPAIKTVFASLNGENFGAKELGVAVTRNSSRFHESHTILHPADCFGDIGAAFFPVSVGLTAMGFLKDYVKSPVLNYASSEAQYRGAVCISKI